MRYEIINEKKQLLGLTNAQLAERAGITLSTLEKITSGANQNPKLSTLQAIARVIGCTLDDFDDDFTIEITADVPEKETRHDNVNIFGERLVSCREKAGFNQRALAERLGISPTRLNYWEKGKREPDITYIKKIAQVLNISIDYLLGNESDNASSKVISTAEVITVFPVKTAQSLNNSLNISSAVDIACKYERLDQHSQKLISAVVDIETERCIQLPSDPAADPTLRERLEAAIAAQLNTSAVSHK